VTVCICITGTYMLVVYLNSGDDQSNHDEMFFFFGDGCRLGLITGTRPGLIVSGRPSLSLVSVNRYGVVVGESSLVHLFLVIMLVPVLTIPDPKRLTIGQLRNSLTYFAQHIG
jgi:hypothetical protein